MSKKFLSATVLSALIFFWACSKPAYVQKSALQWEENFNQPVSFDITRWSKIPRGTSDWNRHMSDFDSCYGMRNGKLILRGIKNNSLPDDTSTYLTGGVYTKDKVVFGLGRLAVRAKLNGAKGAWPAFWMLAENAEWPAGGEIDIMERLNFDSIVYQTVHSYYTVTLNIKDNPPHYATAAINPNEFNTYAVEKYVDSLVFYVNDKKTFTYPRIKTDKEAQFPYADGKHYLLIDMQLGGNWVGKIDPDNLPVEMEIDWVRFYEFKNKSK
ncbi:glycoside hydrolase family 16 protein [Ilyomonas limi]|uniref:Glycoside hydrolase family 16 protein n=1 Tax=Ilyomonas limi TaxID=2575867 RepID=A0A4U3KTJ3_9BACT|nr:glycoside hydrolase family 16 protein [Ilyomonas limi]TKK65835.1 glycoside hydrolase family 16 protein [Ilyomonas limi]